MIYGTCPPEDWKEEPVSASFFKIKSKEKKEEIIVVKSTAMLDENLQLLRRFLLFSIITRTLTQIANKRHGCKIHPVQQRQQCVFARRLCCHAGYRMTDCTQSCRLNYPAGRPVGLPACLQTRVHSASPPPSLQTVFFSCRDQGDAPVGLVCFFPRHCPTRHVRRDVPAHWSADGNGRREFPLTEQAEVVSVK